MLHYDARLLLGNQRSPTTSTGRSTQEKLYIRPAVSGINRSLLPRVDKSTLGDLSMSLIPTQAPYARGSHSSIISHFSALLPLNTTSSRSMTQASAFLQSHRPDFQSCNSTLFRSASAEFTHRLVCRKAVFG